MNLRLLASFDCETWIVDHVTGDTKQIALGIGPEGGWLPFEIEQFEQAGFRQAKLGTWTLGVEVALAVALGQIEQARTVSK
jgi:16S rRNA U1498 N3-methylase RsmE